MHLQDLMDHYDDALVGRKFDNFQFVDFHRVMKNSFRNPEVGFATAALMEIPGACVSLQLFQQH